MRGALRQSAWRTRCVLSIAAFATAAATHAADSTAPPTYVEPVIDTYYGVEVRDPYRWMEDMSSPRWNAWLRRQSDHAEAVLDRIPARVTMRRRVLELADAGDAVSDFERRGDRLFYLRTESGRGSPRLHMRSRFDGPDRMIFDADAIPGEPGHHTIDFYSPSPDGRLVAIGLSRSGSENSVLRVFDIAGGRLRAERIDRTGLNMGVAWLPDGHAFLYNRLPAAAPGGVAERYNRSAIYLHRLGTDAARDAGVFGWGIDPARTFDVPDLPAVITEPGSSWIMVVVMHGDAPERSVYVVRRSELRGARTPWRRLVGREDKVAGAELAGDQVFVLSNLKAPRGRMLRYALRAPGAAPVEVLPESAAVLRQLEAARTHVYVEALDGGVSRLIRVPRGGGPAQDVSLPFVGTVRELEADSTVDDLIVRMEGWTQPTLVYRIDEHGRIRDTGLVKVPSVDLSGIETERVLVRSRDGVEVPLTIQYRKDMPRDGSHPTIVTGYGAYGIAMEPRFALWRLAWLERGGVLATAHVRGGGEFGTDWHNAGRVVTGTKQNTIDDFIACAEYLIRAGYTAKGKLAGAGRSAGGLTIGAAITQRPDLFVAAQIGVGMSDLLRTELTPNGAPNVAEFGSVKNPDQFRNMFAVSPYHHVTDGIAYPAVILTTGVNDPRVDAWEPAKMAAKLQASTVSGRPVLLRVDYEAGHGISSTKTQWTAEQADVWSFFLWQMGDPDFQPH